MNEHEDLLVETDTLTALKHGFQAQVFFVESEEVVVCPDGISVEVADNVRVRLVLHRKNYFFLLRNALAQGLRVAFPY